MPRKLLHLDADAIRARLLAIRKDQAWLADKAGYHKSLVSKIINAGQPTDPQKAADLAQRLGIPLENLLAQPPEVCFETLPASQSSAWVGRKNEMQQLDRAWVSPSVNILCLVGWGGSGKTCLVRQWLARLANSNYRGARRVLAWPFNEGLTSFPRFLAAALEFFGDAGQPGDTEAALVRRLVSFVQRQRTLLILDGLEVFQETAGRTAEAAITNPSVRLLVASLAADNPANGLCLLTTRHAVADLAEFVEAGNTTRLDLDRLTDPEGAALLAKLRVRGTPAQREEIAHAFSGHCLSLTLLGSYLASARNGDPAGWRDINLLKADHQLTGQAGRVMDSYARWLRKGRHGRQLAALSLLGLFDGPADGAAVQALRAAAIEGLSAAISTALLTQDEWELTLSALRRFSLLAPRDAQDPGGLDAHPLVREFWRERLLRKRSAAWKAGHAVLFEHYRHAAPGFPDTAEAMLPLYRAVEHGCAAGMHREAFTEVVWARMCRGWNFFKPHSLGIGAADLGAVGCFFGNPPHAGSTAPNLADPAELAHLSGWAAVVMQGYGRIPEAIAFWKKAYDLFGETNDWLGQNTSSGYLAMLHLNLGRVGAALDYSKDCYDQARQNRRQHDVVALAAFTRAHVLHEAGQSQEAEQLGRRHVGQMLADTRYPALVLPLATHYCEILLDLDAADVRNQLTDVLEQLPAFPIREVIRDYTEGRLHLLRHGLGKSKDCFRKAEQRLSAAIEGFGRHNIQEFLAKGFLARARLYRQARAWDKAQSDLAEALQIAVSCSLRLREADARLERLLIAAARPGPVKARQAALEECAALERSIDELGYLRRRREIEALRQSLMSSRR